MVRLLGAVLTILASGLSLASPAGAQPPSGLTDHITDSTGVLTSSGRAAVSSAIDRLYRDRHIRLWVVYVDNFSRFKPDNWADRTRSASAMGHDDALLAVATNTKMFTFTAPTRLTPMESNSLRDNKIRPAVAAKDWSGAALAAADGLEISASSPHRNRLPIAVVVMAAAVIGLVVGFLLHRRRRRRDAGQSGAGDPQVKAEGHDQPLPQALSTADARLRQISDYVAGHRQSIGAEARARFDEARRELTAARAEGKGNGIAAVAHANRASTLAAQAQTLANADVRAAHRARRSA